MSRLWLFSVLLALLTVPLWAQDVPLLEQARRERDANHYARATELYREVLRTQGESAPVLAELSDVLEAQGHWQETIPYLQQLVKIVPDDAKRLHQVGTMMSWREGGALAALPYLKHAYEVAPGNPTYGYDYADVLARGVGTRGEAKQVLRAVIQMHPDDITAISRLAEILSWSGEDRKESGELYARALELQPDNLALLDQYAEVLSWGHETRPKALELYDRALAIQPEDSRALLGKAQALAWSGRGDEALVLYDRVLAKQPDDTSALRGKAEILNWKGHYEEARTLLVPAQKAAPGDARVALELARSEAGLGHFAVAKTVLAQQQDQSTDFSALREWVHRELGSFMEVGYTVRRTSGQLNYQRASVLLSVPLGERNRISFQYRPTLFQTSVRDFNSNYFRVGLDLRPNDKLTTHLEIGAETYPGFDTQVDGGFTMRYRFQPGWQLDTGFLRSAVDESLLSTRGINSAGQVLGHVRANLGNIGLSYNSEAHHFDASLAYTDGVYTAPFVKANRSWAIDASLGKELRGDRPFIRVAYDVRYWRFDFDADFQPGSGAPPQVMGGYFSPTRFLVNSGEVDISHSFSKKVRWDMTATAGVQNVETTFASFGDVHFASSFATHLFWQMSSRDELRLGYEYLNVFNAFGRNQVTISWRRYF